MHVLSSIDKVEERLSGDYDEVLISDVILPDGYSSHSTTDTLPIQSIFKMFGRQFKLPPDGSVKDYTILYVGLESMFLTNLMLTFSESTVYSYNPKAKFCRKESINVNKLLMKRFYLVEKVKDAQIVGILIATLSVARYLDIVNRLKTLLSHAGKKYYIFSVGKINVPKLANFPDVDVFVLVSCPESVILDSSEYFCPIVTPYEVEMACDPNRQWTGKLVLDYSNLLPGKC
jgi:diphthamide biosynthesis protein 2